MPDRVIRDELLESDRWLGLKEASDRLAFVVLLLTADTCGNAEASQGQLYRLWRDVCGIEREHIEAVSLALADRDLIRLYEHEGKPYLHIPRYRQELRYVKRLHPLSPWTTDEQKQALAKNSRREHDVSTTCARLEVKRSEEKRSKTSCANAGAFDAFWSVYPKKRSKGTAEKAWSKLSPSRELAERIISATTRATTCHDWLRDGGKFVPYPASWLNARGWEDELAPMPETRRVAL